MTFKLRYGGRTYTWIEKGARAALTIDSLGTTTRLLWMGDPQDPTRLCEIDAPIAVLLELSVLRNANRTH